MPSNSFRKGYILVPKIALIGLCGWAIASAASLEAPPSMKLKQLEQRIATNNLNVERNAAEIEKIKQIITADEE